MPAEGETTKNARQLRTRRNARQCCRRGDHHDSGTCPGHESAGRCAARSRQQAPAPEATAAPDNGGKDSATGEIVVTARRTEERLQRVPASVSAFNERALDRIEAQDTTGLQGAVPNLNIVQGRGSSNATNIYIRGIGQPDALQTFDPAVGVYVDDVYLSRIRGNQLDLLDVDRIEVLRGPQGTLYGKNTIGGAIKFVTRKPGRQFRANASLAVGSYNQLELKASASGPLSDTLAAGISVLRSKRDGLARSRPRPPLQRQGHRRRAGRPRLHAEQPLPLRRQRRLFARRRRAERRRADQRAAPFVQQHGHPAPPAGSGRL